MVTESVMISLMIAASRLSGLPAIPAEQMSAVKTISQAEIIAMQCPDDPEECSNIVAFYEMKNNTIFLKNTLDLETTIGQSFLLHEMVHVLQHKAFGSDIFDDCDNTVRSERLAYAVQNKFLINNGLFDRFGDSLAFMTCSNTQDAKQGNIKIEPILVK
jgi:hypothetical protein|uniref:hypothetical protein n=1 Tax=Polynucleobacter sp. TaxID=2029855 RepID=UPI0040486C29